MTNIRAWVELLIFLVLSLAALLFAALVEFVSPFVVPSYAYLGFALICLALLVPFLRDNRLKVKFVVPCLFVAGLILLYSSSWTSRKLFLRDLYSIRPGMSVQQVESVMGKYNAFNIGQPNTRVAASGNLVLVDPNVAAYRHADVNNGQYNGDIGVVRFKNNKVSGIEFMPD